ncbi:MAG: TIGR00341 family protein [Patescibacteria group bacterium]
MSLLFNNITEEDKISSVKDLIDDSTPRPSFFFLVVLSVLMAACGLIINNSAVIIASMLIAPILSPILSLALGIVIADGKLISRSFYTLLKSAGYAVGLSAIITWLLWSFASSSNFMQEFNPEVLERVQPSIVYLLIAIIAGTATAFARVKPDLSETLPGTAIAVALVPPLATIGIGVATFKMYIISGALAMFILNAIGIILAAMVMFSLMNLYTKKTIIAETVHETDKKLAIAKAKHDLEEKTD